MVHQGCRSGVVLWCSQIRFALLTLSAWIPQARVIGVEPTLITLAVIFVVAGQNTSIIPFPERLQKAMGELRVFGHRSATSVNGSVDERLTLCASVACLAMWKESGTCLTSCGKWLRKLFSLRGFVKTKSRINGSRRCEGTAGQI